MPVRLACWISSGLAADLVETDRAAKLDVFEVSGHRLLEKEARGDASWGEQEEWALLARTAAFQCCTGDWEAMAKY